MIVDNLKNIIDRNKDKDSLYLRNLLKEQLQYYILNFIYNSQYGEKFLFKGGTCLRFCFDLPRLSEDVDFDVENFKEFSFEQFTDDIKSYFQSKLRYKDISIKISGKNKIIYLKFPLLKEINFPIRIDKPSENNLFVRIDLSAVQGKNFSKEISLKSTYDFSFIIKRYSPPDIYAGKLAAILTREKWEGKEKEPRFKGRDYFDIFWLESKKIIPNISYLKSIIKVSSNEEMMKMLNKRLKEAGKRKQEIKEDLLPFFAEKQFVNNFVDSLDEFSKNYLTIIDKYL